MSSTAGMGFDSERNNLQALYVACQSIDLTNLEVPSRSFGNFAFSITKLANAIGNRGHDGSELHTSITSYLISLTRHDDVRVALTGIYALFDHGPTPDCVLEWLKQLVNSERRQDDHPTVTARAVALRVLRRLAPEQAKAYVGTISFDEYRCAVEHWIKQSQSLNTDCQAELDAERRWIELLASKK